MGKIKLSLESGVNVEKPLVTVFKVNENQYVILDNEMTGSMGLPIILVCKLINNRLVKIIDSNEWTNVKEYLKQIIAGNKMDYINIGSELSADDIYYTQLTLPIQSFDILKNSYKVDESLVQSTQPVVAPVEPVVAPVEPVVAPVEPVVAPVEPVVAPVEPVVAPVEPVVAPVEPVVAPVEPVVAPVEPEIVTSPINNTTIEQPITIESSIPSPAPVTPVSVAIVNSETKYKEEKEAFMQACENMFNALVQKFEKDNKE